MNIFPPSTRPVLVQWQVDTRSLWPEATQTRQLSTVAARALAALLTDEERTGVLKYFHVRDAKMALVSQLLKHLVVARCGVSWRDTAITRDSHGKPIFKGGDGKTVVFNVSHQAGLVVLVAVYGGNASLFDVGIDVVSPSERRTRDRQMIEEEDNKVGGRGWPHYVDMHADVLSPREVHYLKAGLSLRDEKDRDDKDNRLRYFYALWCLREAYVKMTGEALLAEWLGELEFRNFVPPQEGDGQKAVSHDIRFKGKQVDDANVCLQSVGADYMVCTAVRSCPDKSLGLALPTTDAFDVLQMDDILDFVDTSSAV
ncbi:phosphopantetheinyl transferase [Ophiostoma piceae UAMH 11346]|uniref:holo-[acyl-carrier-protein] synthase n=1 Tax=Ophiostoma piceae (strain UAMH 11346) TaxID=1262450 RepID=S3D502_OPHP1|nr:phosphopantetheinyl transferase [Ophiostoma piceae UAMH 11346]